MVLNIIALWLVLMKGISSIIQPELLLSSFVPKKCCPAVRKMNPTKKSALSPTATLMLLGNNTIPPSINAMHVKNEFKSFN